MGFFTGNPKSSGGGGGFFTGGGSAAPAAAPAKKGGGGFLGGVGKLAHSVGNDVVDIATGFPGGIKHTAGTLGAVAKEDVTQAIHHPTETQSLHDFIHGKPGSARAKLGQLEAQTAQGIKQDFQHPLRHPVYTALDLLTAADLGTTGAARLAGKSSVRSALEVRSPRLAATGEGPVATKLSETKPLVRARQAATNKALNRVQIPRRGYSHEAARYGSAIRQKASLQGLREMPAYYDYVKATKSLSPAERKALNILPRDVHPDDLAEFWKGKPIAKIVSDPKVRALVLNPTKRLARADEAARKLSEAGAHIFGEQGLLREDTAAARLGQFRQTVSEGLGREARPLHGEPYYLPDVPKATKTANPFAGQGGGKGIPKPPGSTKANQQILARLGKLDLTRDVLGPEFTGRVRLKVHSAIHDLLTEGAVKQTPAQLAETLSEHGGLPKGWEYVRAPIVTKTGSIRAQRISPVKQIEGETAALPQNLLHEPQELTRHLSEPMGTLDQHAAHFDGQFYYLAPKATIRKAAGEFHRTTSTVAQFIDKPMQVWRALVLGLRVGFFTNNFIGNHLLAAVRTAGMGGLRSYLHAVYNTHGAATVRRLLNQPDIPRGISQQFMREFFPEQIEGTFGRSQSPALERLPSGVGKTAEKLKLGLAPATQAAAEGVPRRALVETMIRNSPEFRQTYRALPKQTRTFEDAARNVLNGTGGEQYQHLISEQVNRSLGNYLNLSPVERGAIRNLLPFYSWYRAIATITFHLAADTPGRALAVAQLGRIGAEDEKNLLGQLPDYLRGFIPIGHRGPDGLQTGLSTGGLNPYATIPQLGSGAAGDVTSLGLSPFITAPVDVLSHLQHGQKIGVPHLAAQSAKTIATGLPLSRLISPQKPSKLYPKRGHRSELLSYLGAPVKQLNVAEANRRAAKGG